MVHGRALQSPLTVPRVRFVGVSVTCTFVAVEGPLLVRTGVLWFVPPGGSGPEGASFLAMTTSTARVEPPLLVLSVLLAVFGSNSAGVAVALLSKEPTALIVAVTVMLFWLATPTAIDAIVHGRALQSPLTLVRVRFAGVSVTWTFVAVDGPLLVT